MKGASAILDKEVIPLAYLDCKNERGSWSIMRELGVDLLHSNPFGGEVPIKNLSVEHNATATVTFTCDKGVLFVDVRDSGDCWLRTTLLPGQGALSVPGSVYRRVLQGVAGMETVVLCWGAGAPWDLVRQYRFHTSSDERLNCAQPYHSTRELVCELCRNFFEAGWVTGTGGSISIRHGNRIYMTPSGVQKERIAPDELFVLDIDGNVLSTPAMKPTFTPKLSDCSPLFLHAFKQRHAGAVLHSHALSTNLVTSLCEGQAAFRISHQEMIKGIAGHGYFDELVVPIIENTAHEHELADALGECIANNPKSCAVLVRRHGMYVWGKTWEEAKRHGECLHYLFEVALSMKRLGMDFNSPPLPVGVSVTSGQKRGLDAMDGEASAPSKRLAVQLRAAHTYKHVVFDIEGTTTPITFVKDVLFPYSAKHVEAYLVAHKGAAEVMTIAHELAPIDKKGKKKTEPHEVALAVQALIAQDSKLSFLKKLQGLIWEEAYTSGAIKSSIYADVPASFRRLSHAGVKVSIYSSGSRSAQRLLFKHSDRGDLRSLISCYFDTKVGNKREADSYREIVQSLGVDSASEILFVTDILEEAQAAKEAGLDCIISSRPGNAPLSSKDHSFQVVTTFDEL